MIRLLLVSNWLVNVIRGAVMRPEWFFARNSRLITVAALALVMTFGMMSIVSNVQDIVRMRKKFTLNIQL